MGLFLYSNTLVRACSPMMLRNKGVSGLVKLNSRGIALLFFWFNPACNDYVFDGEGLN